MSRVPASAEARVAAFGEDKVAAFGRGLVATLRRWAAEGVPYQNQGIDPEFGLDCIGAVVAAARQNGLALAVANDWGRTGRSLDRALLAYCRRVGVGRLQDGDLVVMGRLETTHAGVAVRRADGSWGLLHADAKGVHESALRLSLPAGHGNAVHPVRGYYRVRAEALEAG